MTAARDIPAHLVVDFDLYNLPGAGEDIQLAYHAFQQTAPDIFWTHHNGGHWVATRTDDIRVIQTDHMRFSHEPALSIPPVYSPERNYPIQVDPPAHKHYRAPLVKAMQPRIVDAMIPKIRDTTRELIDAFANDGSCEFVGVFGEIFPIVMFLDLVELPRDDRKQLLAIAKSAIRGNTVEMRVAAFNTLSDYLTPWIERRRSHPGEDLISLIVNVEIDGAKISFADALTFARTVLLGGLDTVTGVLSAIMRFFALNPAHRRMFGERMDDAAFVRRAVEELLRRHGIVNTTRVAAGDFDYNGVPFRNGDMIMVPNLCVGLDDRHVTDPLVVDFDRPAPPVHALFDFGPHTCVGAALARSEIRTFLREWFAKIPDFTIKPGTTPVTATGMVNAILSLHLAWDVDPRTI